MMETVYKYPLAWKVWQGIWLPLKRVLTVEIQNGVPRLWAVVDTSAPAVKLRVMMTSTGTDDKLDFDKLRYISTTQYGGYVFHWFYEDGDSVA